MKQGITIDELQKLKNDLNKKLMLVISEQISWFEKETGLTPQKINVDMVPITEFGDLHPHFCLGSVSVDIQL